MNKSGFKGFEETAPWLGYFPPKNTPELIVKPLHAANIKDE